MRRYLGEEQYVDRRLSDMYMALQNQENIGT
jgi:hypothetical protein